jgi:hypothetical protein
MKELQLAIGQFGVYQIYLDMIEPKRKLFIALSEKIYDEFFSQKAIQVIVEKINLSMILVNLENEEVVRWIK